ncbi:MAG TPA: cardiolipin synthase [Syntrophomonadaceae bacterium]|nr:cardiolipin synthase [Syntrophomonadaceae bacterium]
MAQIQSFFDDKGSAYHLPPLSSDPWGLGIISTCNEITLLNNGEPTYACMLEKMNRASSSIHLELFSIRNDDSSKAFARMLILKARQGLQVRLLYDALGSLSTSKSYFDELLKNGVQVAAFNPLPAAIVQGRINNRLHRKIVVIDGTTAFLGGENIGDECLGKNKKIGFWRDTDIMVQGNAARSLQEVFLYDWFKASGTKVESAILFPAVPDTNAQGVKIALGGPDSETTDLSLAYSQLISQAKANIYIASPYFTPNDRIVNALVQAASRGVTIDILIPRKTDHWSAQYARQDYLHRLVECGVRIHLYNPGFLHSKLVIIDGQTASVGSANFDELSFYRNYEIGVIISDRKIISQLEAAFQKDLEDSDPVTIDSLQEKNPLLTLTTKVTKLLMKVM